MRKRTVVYTPSLASIEYDVGGHKIRLLPGIDRNGFVELQSRLKDLIGDDSKAAQFAICIAAFYLWDDANYEFSVDGIDPDTVLDLDGADLLSAAAQCYDSINKRKSLRAGFVPTKMIAAVISASNGNIDKLGKETPAETKPSA